jgi:hypothetical protein
MSNPRFFLLWVFSSFSLVSGFAQSPSQNTANGRDDLLRQASVIDWFVGQGIVRERNEVEPSDSLSNRVVALLDTYLPRYLTGSKAWPMVRISAVTRGELAKYIDQVRLEAAYSLKRLSRLRIPNVVCAEFQAKTVRFVGIVYSQGYTRALANYNRSLELNRNLKSVLIARGPVSSQNVLQIMSMEQVVRYASSLELVILDIQNQQVVHYKRDILSASAVDSLTVKQHLATLFRED